MKLYFAMVVGIAIGAGVAIFVAARELEDDHPPAAAATGGVEAVPGTSTTTGA